MAEVVIGGFSKEIGEAPTVYHTTFGRSTFHYIGPAAWGRNNLRPGIGFPQTVYVATTMGGTKVFYPEHDLAPQGRFQRFMTADHSRMLHTLLQRRLLPRDPNRILVNVDWQSDIVSGDPYEIDLRSVHCGNWGSAGFFLEFWGRIINVTSSIEKVINLERRMKLTGAKRTVDLPVTYVPTVLAAEVLPELLSTNNFLLTFCSDEFADFVDGFTQDRRQRLREIVTLLKNFPGLELLHFSASPEYCPQEAAKEMWDIIVELTS